MSTGRYPNRLKIAIIAPIFKSGDCTNPRYYRPISTLSVFNNFLIYIPPDKSRDVVFMEDHIATVRELSVSANSEAIILACGDYNQPRLAWSNDDNSLRLDNPILLTPASAALIDGMDFLNMNQINAQLNHLRRTLDLVFLTEGSHASHEVLTAVDSLVSVDPHHPPLTIRFNAPAKSVTSLPVGNVEERKINYRKIDFDSLSAHLSGSDWSCIYDCTNVHDMAFKFCDIIRQWLIANVPLKRCPISPPWSTPLLRRAKRVRNQWQRRMRTHRSNFTKVNFKHASDDYRHLNAALYKSHVLRVQFGLRRDPKSFWSFVNSKRKNPIVSSNLVYEDKESSDEAVACDFFARHFASEPSSDSDAELAASNIVADAVDLDTFEILPAMIIHASKKLKNSFSPGPDGIPASVFCRCIIAVAEPLAFIFRHSFERGVFPMCWKESYMLPVHKSGDRRNVKNYRGITSLPAASKIFEIIVSVQILHATKSHISSDQHGFIPGRSVSTNLLDFTSTCRSFRTKGTGRRDLHRPKGSL
ncbi:uncharacterized protein LOC129773603 [Toxorhynchites rutilus septentrionalis]|uniref:uncharacterized protein LOC129773603 n=1 Tax=Toxorhynchites rutilus septentrionalis TaxID=329112 RepID=UPI00247A19C9|nr:uncharacterized protein LOC129773603 [Toxorhynchites rutilus septentrionalis]